MRRPIETLAEGLGHPEGPDILPDGRIVFVETYTSKIMAWSAERGIHDYVRVRWRPERLHARVATARCTSPRTAAPWEPGAPRS